MMASGLLFITLSGVSLVILMRNPRVQLAVRIFPIRLVRLLILVKRDHWFHDPHASCYTWLLRSLASQ